jgi:hypothetical protein
LIKLDQEAQKLAKIKAEKLAKRNPYLAHMVNEDSHTSSDGVVSDDTKTFRNSVELKDKEREAIKSVDGVDCFPTFNR